MGKKDIPIVEEQDKYEFLVNPSKRTGKTQQLEDEVITTTLYMPAARSSGFSTNRPVEWLLALERLYLKIHTCWLNIEDKNGKYHETQIFIYNTSGDKCLTIHVFNSTGVILAKGAFWKEWADLEFPVLLTHVQNQSSNEQCPSTSFLEVINKQKLKSGLKTKNKSNINNQTGENSPIDDSNKLAEETNNDDLFDSIENLWDENQQLKSSLELLDKSLVNVNKSLADIKSHISKQEQMVIDKLKTIETQLDSKISLFSEEIEKSVNQKLKNLRKEMSDKVNNVNQQFQKHLDERFEILPVDNSTKERTPITEDLADRVLKLESDKVNVSNMISEFEKSIETNYSCLNDFKVSVQIENVKLKDKLQDLEESGINLRNKLTKLQQQQTQSLHDDSKALDLKMQTTVYSRFRLLEERLSLLEKQKITKEEHSVPSIHQADICSGTQEWSSANEPEALQDSDDKRIPLKDRLTTNDSVAWKYSSENDNKGVKSFDDRIHSQYQDPSIWILMDSNRRYLRENRLSPDNTRGVKIVACGNLDDLEILTDSIPDDLEILFLHVGVNDLELHAAERVHKEYCSIISKIKEDFPNLKIVLSEITLRFDILDNQVLRLNALLLDSFKNDESVYIIKNSNLRKESYFSDNKHIKKDNINILAGNIKHGLRRILGIRFERPSNAHNRGLSPDYGKRTESNRSANSLSEKTSENILHINGTATKTVNLIQSILSDFQGFAGR